MARIGPDDPEANATGGELLPGVPMQPEEPQGEELFAKGARELPEEPDDELPQRAFTVGTESPVELLVRALEKLLHEELPQSARHLAKESHERGRKHVPPAAIEDLEKVVKRLDDLQRELGLATYELMRKGGQVQTQAARWQDLTEETIPSRPKAAPRSGPSCTAAPCSRTSGVSACTDCGKLYCPSHHDPALHPCGEEL